MWRALRALVLHSPWRLSLPLPATPLSGSGVGTGAVIFFLTPPLRPEVKVQEWPLLKAESVTPFAEVFDLGSREQGNLFCGGTIV